MKHIVLIFFLVVLFSTPTSVFAEYVLPYPFLMPGNKIYKISRMADVIKRYWSFGSIAQTKYSMSMADKYLVEAKTLFEYKQYLLAFDAIERSDQELSRLPENIRAGGLQRKNMSLMITSIKEEINMHEKVLKKLQAEMPSEFTWTPEKKSPTILPIQNRLEEAILFRRRVSDEVEK